MSVTAEPYTPIVEPPASTKTPPVFDWSVTASKSDDMGFGVYAVAQRSDSGQYWNRTTQAFEPRADLSWPDYAFRLFSRGAELWGRYVGADELPAGNDYVIRVFIIKTPSNDGESLNSGSVYRPDIDPQIGSFKRVGWPKPLPNTVRVDHDTGGTDNYQIVDPGNNPVEGVSITAHLTSEFATLQDAAPSRGASITDKDGRWARPIRLSPATDYTLHFAKDGYSLLTVNLTTGAKV